GQVALIWQSGSAVALPTPDGYFSGAAHDISETSVIVGSVGDSDFVGPQHCVWQSPGSTPDILPGLIAGSTSGAAWAVNEAGQIAGVSGSPVGNFYAAR